ncbi:MAG: hypothetical protein FWD85_06970 [Microbacteriaceae bacterium]|nr:hypothetical protein [Microbacteriaceae bacterium]
MSAREYLVPGWTQLRWSLVFVVSLAATILVSVAFLFVPGGSPLKAAVGWVAVGAWWVVVWSSAGKAIKRWRERRAGYTTMPPDERHPELDEVDARTGFVIRKGSGPLLENAERADRVARARTEASRKPATAAAPLPWGWPRR